MPETDGIEGAAGAPPRGTDRLRVVRLGIALGPYFTNGALPPARVLSLIRVLRRKRAM